MEYLFRWRYSVLSFVLLVIVLAGIGIPQLEYNSDTRVFYGEDDARLNRLLDFEETFQPTRKVLFIVSSSLPLESDSVKRDALKWLSDQTMGLPYALRADSLATVSYPHAKGEDIVVEPYLEYLCPQSCIPARLEVLKDPLVLRRLVSESREHLAVMGVFDVGDQATSRLTEIALRVRTLKAKFMEEYPKLEIRATGGIPVSQAYVEAGRRDVSSLFLVAAILIVFVLRLLLGSLKYTALMLGIALSAVIVAMGIGGWIGVELNSASSTIPIIVLTLVVASTMHLFTHYLRLCASGVIPESAIVTAVNANYVPIALTTITTGISLASLVFISSPPIRDIGILSGIGVLFGGVFAIIVTPLLLKSSGDQGDSATNRYLQSQLNKYARTLEGGKSIPTVGFLVLLFVGLGLPRLEIDDDFVAYLSDRTVERQDTDFALEKLAGPSHVELSIESKTSVFDPSFLIELQDITEKIRAMGVVSSATSLTDVLINLTRAFGDRVDLGELSEEALNQYFFVYELGLRAGDSAYDLVDIGKTKTHLTILMGSTSAKDVRQIESDIDAMLAGYSTFTGMLTGENSPVAYLSSSNIPAISFTVATSLIFTSLGLGIFFRNWRIGLNAFLAISIPLLVGLGGWGWVAESIGLAGSLVIAIALGVVIDDAIHLIYQQRKAWQRGDGALGSTAYSVHRVGVPIVATTVLFLVGLAPLLFSDFRVNVTFAACTSMILLVSLLFDLMVLPKLLTWSVSKELEA